MWSTSDKPPFNPDFLALFRKWCFPDLYRTSSCLITLTWQHPMERRLQSFHHHSHFLDPGFSQKSLAWLRTGLRRLLATHVRPIQMGSSGQQAQIATMVEKYRLKKYLVQPELSCWSGLGSVLQNQPSAVRMSASRLRALRGRASAHFQLFRPRPLYFGIPPEQYGKALVIIAHVITAITIRQDPCDHSLPDTFLGTIST